MLDKLKIKSNKVIRYGVLVVTFLLAISLVNSMGRFIAATSSLKSTQERLEALKQDNESLRKEVERVGSQDYIEKAARDKLGLAFEGESVLVLPDDEVLKLLSTEREKKQEVVPDPNWKKWMNLFL